MCVNVAILETLLYLSGFYRRQELSKGYMLFICLLMGVGDALVTFVNMEQMMFFYRLYYADWYLALYMLVNGLVYSSIGAWLGAKTGSKCSRLWGNKDAENRQFILSLSLKEAVYLKEYQPDAGGR